MIISHQHKYIFIKTNKTAGTSIEIALSRFCGKNDIITKNFPEEEKLRKQLGYPGPQNYIVPIYKYSLSDWSDVISKVRMGDKRIWKRFYSHSSAREIIKIIGDDTWNNYYKFCFERNPWDRVISYYYFIVSERAKRGKPTPELSEFIQDNWLHPLKKHGIDNYTINGEIAVDRVCLYEDLETALQNVCNHLGIPEKPVLPTAKSGLRADQRPYREILNKADKDKIAGLFADEIRYFGYEF